MPSRIGPSRWDEVATSGTRPTRITAAFFATPYAVRGYPDCAIAALNNRAFLRTESEPDRCGYAPPDRKRRPPLLIRLLSGFGINTALL